MLLRQRGQHLARHVVAIEHVPQKGGQCQLDLAVDLFGLDARHERRFAGQDDVPAAGLGQNGRPLVRVVLEIVRQHQRLSELPYWHKMIIAEKMQS